MLFSTTASAFPEIPFCPIGGPPGWFNRMTGDSYNQYRYPPAGYPLTYPQAYPPAYPAYPYSTPARVPLHRGVNPGAAK